MTTTPTKMMQVDGNDMLPAFAAVEQVNMTPSFFSDRYMCFLPIIERAHQK
jgi:hypothetical protein